jgi:hypothetical protein
LAPQRAAEPERELTVLGGSLTGHARFDDEVVRLEEQAALVTMSEAEVGATAGGIAKLDPEPPRVDVLDLVRGTELPGGVAEDADRGDRGPTSASSGHAPSLSPRTPA